MIVSQTKTFFYLFSLPPDATCTHWSVDVVFEDNSHIRLDEAHENLAVIRYMVFNLLKHCSAKRSLNRQCFSRRP